MRTIVLLLLVACHAKSDGPPCPTVASQVFTMAQAELAKATVDPTTRRAVSDQLPAIRDQLAQVCHEGAWSAQVRDCMVKAADHVALQACEQQLTDDQRKALDRAARGDTSTP